MNISELMEKGIEKIRKPNWSDPDTYLQLEKVGEYFGPWAKLKLGPIESQGWSQKRIENLSPVCTFLEQGQDWVEYKPKGTDGFPTSNG